MRWLVTGPAWHNPRDPIYGHGMADSQGESGQYNQGLLVHPRREKTRSARTAFGSPEFSVMIGVSQVVIFLRKGLAFGTVCMAW